MIKFITILVLASNIFAFSARADQGLDKCPTLFRNLSQNKDLKNSEFIKKRPSFKTEGKLSSEETIAFFGIRNRIRKNNTQWTFVETNEEAQTLNKLSGRTINIGTKVTVDNLKMLLLDYNKDLIYSLAIKRFRFSQSYLELNDLVQAAYEGALTAFDKFDSEVKSDPISFMSLLIKQRISAEIANYMPIYLKASEGLEKIFKANSVANDIAIKTGKTPTLEQIVDRYKEKFPEDTPLTKSKAKILLDKYTALNSVFSIFENPENTFDIAATENAPSLIEQKQIAQFILNMFDEAGLDNRAKIIMVLKIGLPFEFDHSGHFTFDPNLDRDPMTYENIGQLLGLSKQRIFQIDMAAIKDLLENIKTSADKLNAVEETLGFKPKIITEWEKDPFYTQLQAAWKKADIKKFHEEQEKADKPSTLEGKIKKLRKKYGNLIAP